MPTARSGLGGAVYEDKLYVIGGESTSGVIGEVDAYHPVDDRWEIRRSKPTPVADIAAAAIAGKIYIPGGRLASGQPTDLLEIYDPLNDTWGKGARVPINVSGYALAGMDGKLYLFGGWDGSQVLDTVYEYSPDGDQWTKKSSMGTARQFAGAAVVSGKILISGGYDGKRALTINEIYSPELDTRTNNPWSTRAALPEGRYSMGMTSVANIVYLVGGKVPGKAVDREALLYSYQNDKWQRFEKPPKGISSGSTLIPFDTYLYMLGGLNGEVPTAYNLAYQAIYNQMVPIIVR
ncbi:MAG: kelch repeat-containing protein [Anaerolineaceae bacterium]|nr:kelch repeat-containing protein [Anaerolineaceae bacterium]